MSDVSLQGSGGLDRRIEAWIEHAAGRDDWGHVPLEEDFNALALELFAYQYERNRPYRRYCSRRGAEPGRLAHWSEIPPVPIDAFKELTLSCEPPGEAAAVFMTSGSTDPTRRGRNYHPHLRLYDASLRHNFARHFLPNRKRIRLLVLNARSEELPNSSLAYFLGRLVDFHGAPGSGFFVRDGRLDLEGLLAVLREAEVDGEPIGLLGASFAYVHLLDALEEADLSFGLSEGSRVLDTGGFKGRSREVSAETLRALFGERLGVPDPFCVNYYGMTEISTQYYDHGLRSHLIGEPAGPRHKTVPPWARISVVDPETREPLAAGERGLIVHHDLANRGSCLAVLTEDVGYLLPPGSIPESEPPGFVLLGRAKGTEARGCSVALDELLAADRGPGV
ncbi:MAG: hypothetical protein M3Q49_20315 [Actinomycetota bacterium]|nr:hypothetical protein [Actinomycetota bacterium]